MALPSGYPTIVHARPAQTPAFRVKVSSVKPKRPESPYNGPPASGILAGAIDDIAHHMSKKTLFPLLLSALLLGVAVIQFIPGAPLVIPAELPAADRATHRHLNFEGIDNFRDLGGYPTESGATVKWGVLYRSGMLAEASRADLEGLNRLNLSHLVDFRSELEKDTEPDRYPEANTFKVVEIPTLDGGDDTVAADIMRRIDEGDFEGFDPNALMLDANRAFATDFLPEYTQFFQTVLEADGAPILWHCTAGKDRAGFAAAALLRVLGVPQDVIVRDYMLSKEHSLASRKNELRLLRLFKGDEAADKLEVIMGVEEAWIEAAFATIDERWGSFDNYMREGLGLSDDDIARLRTNLLTDNS